jgi:dienelactone hydrolase
MLPFRSHKNQPTAAGPIRQPGQSMNTSNKIYTILNLALAMACSAILEAAEPRAALSNSNPPLSITHLFTPPQELSGQFGKSASLLTFRDGSKVSSPADWQKRRAEIRAEWEREIGTWPPLLEKPLIETLSLTNRNGFTQHTIRVEVAPGLKLPGYILLPHVDSPAPGVVVPYYDPESSVGLGKTKLRDFASELARRGFAAIAIGSPGGDARQPDLAGVRCQPLHFLGYIAANARNALAQTRGVDPSRIAIVGHSYGGKWAMFAACFDEKFAAGVWSDPGIVFDESRPNINYWEPWYLGADAKLTRKPGLPTPENPRTGAYKRLFEAGHDLHEVQALMAPRPFLVSGGAEDPPERWHALNRINEVYHLLGATNRVAMSNRPLHDPTADSNEQIYLFLEHFLGNKK